MREVLFHVVSSVSFTPTVLNFFILTSYILCFTLKERVAIIVPGELATP